MKNSIAPDIYNDLKFIKDLKEKRLSAINQFYDDYAPAFYGYIKSVLYKNDVSEETLGAIFRNILTSINKYNPNKERLFSWANRIAREEVSKHKRDLMVEELLTC